MNVMKDLLILSILSTAIYIIYIVFDGSRRTENLSSLMNTYSSKPSLNRRVVVVIPCEDNVSEVTLKSLLSQSKRVSSINIETLHPEKISDKVKLVASVHKPDTVKLRETETDTLIIFVENGKWYEYDFIENNARTI